MARSSSRAPGPRGSGRGQRESAHHHQGDHRSTGMSRSGPTPGIAAPTPSLATAERTLSTMDTDQPTTVTITLKLSTEEAQDLAVLLPRLVADRLTRFS